MGLRFDTSFVAFGVLNPIVNSERTTITLRSLDWRKDERELRALDDELVARARADDPDAFALRALLKASRPAQEVEVARGSEGGKVRKRPPDRESSDEIKRLLASCGLSCEERAQLERDLPLVLRLEDRTMFYTDEPKSILEHVGRIAPQVADKLAHPSSFVDIQKPFPLALAPGELKQLVLRVRHGAPCVIRIEQHAQLASTQCMTASDRQLPAHELVDVFTLIVRHETHKG